MADLELGAFDITPPAPACRWPDCACEVATPLSRWQRALVRLGVARVECRPGKVN